MRAMKIAILSIVLCGGDDQLCDNQLQIHGTRDINEENEVQINH